jgi:hypothetical protein
MDLQTIEQMTAEYGETWAMPHVHRLFHLIDRIHDGISYDREALTYAVYLHDWGAFPHFRRSGVDHGLRSRQIAEEEILPSTSLTVEQKKIVLEAVEFHDYRCVLPVWTSEALLLREADFLDFLGAIGVAREIAWNPSHLHIAMERLATRRDGIRGHFTIPAAQKIAEERLLRMDQILAWIKAESLGEL